MSECPVCLRATESPICHRCARYLHGKLSSEVSTLCDELGVSRVRLTRTTRPGDARRGSETPLPYDERSAAAYDRLIATLTAWHDHLRGIHPVSPHEGAESTLGRWLAKHVGYLQRDDQAELAYEQIIGAITEGWRVVDLPADRERTLLGLCQGCGTRVDAAAGDDHGECPTCGEPLHADDAHEVIDQGMGGLHVTARQAAELVNLRYGTKIRAKTIYDMAYRKTDPIPSMKHGGKVTFWMRVIVDDLRRQGKIA